MPLNGAELVPEVDLMRPPSVNLKPLIVVFDAFIFIVPVIVDSLLWLVVQSMKALLPKNVNPLVVMSILPLYVPLATYTVEFSTMFADENVAKSANAVCPTMNFNPLWVSTSPVFVALLLIR